MSNRTPRDHWPIHGGDPATYTITPPTGYETATDWRLTFRAAPLPYAKGVLTPAVDTSALGDDPAIVAFSFDPDVVEVQHDGYEGDVECSLGTLLTIILKVEDDWTP